MTVQTRLKKLQAQLQPKQAFLLSNPHDITYFANFFSLVPTEREAFLVITPSKAILLRTNFSPYQVQPEVNAHPSCSLKTLQTTLRDLKDEIHLKTVFLDKENLFVNEYEVLQKLRLKLLPLDRTLIWQLRTIKDEMELKYLREAGQVTRQVMTEAWSELKPGLTEKQVRNLLEAKIKRKGSQRPAFPTIVAFGANTALPHHQPTEAKLKKEMPVLLDFGATINGYCGDMTRSGWFGQKPNKKFLEIKRVVRSAYDEALNEVGEIGQAKTAKSTQDQSKVMAKDVDQAARSVIAEAGYGQYFIHTTGHGLGLDIHESLSLNHKNDQLIEPGMVITLEPGIYLKGKFGYRYENMVLVKKDDTQELTI